MMEAYIFLFSANYHTAVVVVEGESLGDAAKRARQVTSRHWRKRFKGVTPPKIKAADGCLILEGLDLKNGQLLLDGEE